MKPDIKLLIFGGWSFSNSVWEGIDFNPFAPLFFEWRELLCRDVLEDFRDDRVVILGWSLGGMKALEGVLVYKNIEGLLLLNTSAKPLAKKGEAGIKKRVLESMKEGVVTDKKAVLEEFAKNSFYPLGLTNNILKHLSLDAEVKELILGLEYLERFDVKDRLKDIATPVFVLHAKDDRIIPLSHGEFLADSIEGSSFEGLEGGHFVQDDAKKKIEEILKGLYQA